MSNSESPQGGQTDEQLMLAFVHGNRDAFDEPFRRYRQSIYGFFCRRVNTDGRAEELTQETFLAILHAASRYQPRALFRTYLFSIAFRILVADRRKTGIRAFFLVGSAPKEPAAKSSNDEILWIHQAIARLEEAEREVLLLREFEQFGYAEIADVLDIPLNTVKSRLFRARLALREQLEGAQPAKTPPLGELA